VILLDREVNKLLRWENPFNRIMIQVKQEMDVGKCLLVEKYLGFFVVVVAVVVSESGSGYVAQAGLKLSVLLSQPPKCWDYRCASPLLFWKES
jgi:hypothetical protein